MIDAPAEGTGDHDRDRIFQLLRALERELRVGKILVDGMNFDRNVKSLRPCDRLAPRGIEIADQKLRREFCSMTDVDAVIDAPNSCN